MKSKFLTKIIELNVQNFRTFTVNILRNVNTVFYGPATMKTCLYNVDPFNLTFI